MLLPEMRRVLSFFGTRPEAIKMAPVAHAFAELSTPGMVHLLCNTGQHRDLVRPLLDWFQLKADHSLDLMTDNQSLAGFTARALTAVDALLEKTRPDLVLCQGDTTTAMVVGLAAFYRRIPVGHVEAGLRTHNRFAPFPEEINRCIIDLVADHCFAPTVRSAEELRKAGVSQDRITVTGNTAIDALLWTLQKLKVTELPSLNPPGVIGDLLAPGASAELALVTAHRRESFGEGIGRIARAVRHLAHDFPQLQWIWPVHPNPNVRGPLQDILRDERRIHLVEPLDYPLLCSLLARSTLVLTDSGGLQEECPTLGIPVFVMREVSERPEGIEAGNAVLAGTHEESIVQAVRRFFEDGEVRTRMCTPRPVYGDGTAGLQIAQFCSNILAGSDRSTERRLHEGART
ncbi:MAG: UDP-N-acetylglucosamine 2-epimerase (non-hydrolyzing) [Acidobacteriota bacterium]